MHTEVDFTKTENGNRTKADVDAAVVYYQGIPEAERSGDDIDQLKYLLQLQQELA